MSAIQNAIVLTGHGYGVTALAEAEEARNDLLRQARRGTIITKPEGAERVAVLLKEIAAFNRTIESQRQEVKAPVLEIGKQIDELAKTLCLDLKFEATRLGNMLATWNRTQAEIAEIERQRRQDELDRIRLDNERKQREADEEAEIQRKALLAKAAAASTPAAAERVLTKLDAVNDAKRAEDETRAAAASATEGSAVMAIKRVVTPTTKGIASRRVPVIDTVDCKALYDAVPFLVTLEPKSALIVAALKDLSEGQTLPGVKWHWEDRSTVR